MAAPHCTRCRLHCYPPCLEEEVVPWWYSSNLRSGCRQDPGCCPSSATFTRSVLFRTGACGHSRRDTARSCCCGSARCQRWCCPHRRQLMRLSRRTMPTAAADLRLPDQGCCRMATRTSCSRRTAGMYATCARSSSSSFLACAASRPPATPGKHRCVFLVC